MKTSGSRRIAERYVQALFDVSGSALDKIEADLKALATLTQENTDFTEFLSNPLLTRAAQAKIMEAISAKAKLNPLTAQFMQVLAEQKRLNLLPDIASLFLDKAAAARGELKATLISASPLKEKDAAAAGEKLSKIYGKKVNLEVREDASLLGGVIVKIGSQQLDSSLAGKMQRLKIALQAA